MYTDHDMQPIYQIILCHRKDIEHVSSMCEVYTGLDFINLTNRAHRGSNIAISLLLPLLVLSLLLLLLLLPAMVVLLAASVVANR
jgi:hypothetical protein